jgi:hypothetical protein
VNSDSSRRVARPLPRGTLRRLVLHASHGLCVLRC